MFSVRSLPGSRGSERGGPYSAGFREGNRWAEDSLRGTPLRSPVRQKRPRSNRGVRSRTASRWASQGVSVEAPKVRPPPRAEQLRALRQRAYENIAAAQEQCRAMRLLSVDLTTNVKLGTVLVSPRGDCKLPGTPPQLPGQLGALILVPLTPTTPVQKNSADQNSWSPMGSRSHGMRLHARPASLPRASNYLEDLRASAAARRRAEIYALNAALARAEAQKARHQAQAGLFSGTKQGGYKQVR